MRDKIVICPFCKAEISESSYFCHSCGKFIKGEIFENADFYSSYEVKIMRILENLPKVPHAPIIWDDTIDIYAKKVERLKAMFDLKDLNVKSLNSDLTEKITTFLEKCRRPEFQIAFVGTIKTGKSTLINSLLGSNYASMDVTPETAALTKFRYSAKDYIQVTFYTKKEWTALWKSITSGADEFMKEYNALHAADVKDKWVGHEMIRSDVENAKIKEELTRWSSSKHPEHYFVKEIEVGISSLPKEIPSEVVFVDTPGLMDPVAYRSEITRSYIRRADAVFVCVDAQKILKDEIATIAGVFSFSSDARSKVFVIATHWDAMNNLEADWDKQYKYLLSRLVGEAFYETEEMAKSNIMYSASYIFNLIRDINHLDKTELRALLSFSIKLDYLTLDEVKKNLNAIREKTNVAHVLDTITNVLVRNYKSIMMRELCGDFKNIIYELRRIGDEKSKQERELIGMSGESLQNIKKQMEKVLEKQKKISTVQERLQTFLQSVEKKTNERLTKTLSVLDKYIEETC